MLSQVKLADLTHKVKMIPIYEMYMKGDSKRFMRTVFDHIWFNDGEMIEPTYSNKGGYDYYIEKKTKKHST